MKQITSGQLKEWLESGHDFQLIDVREGWEREAYNIGGLHMPMSELLAHTTEIPKHKDVVLYCEKGIRSVLIIQRLESSGFSNLINLSGGMSAWKAQS